MAEESPFDPYRKWLGIPPREQPPHHYRLLGLDLFEQDADVIGTAADARMVHLKTFASGKHSEVSQRILNEVAAAQLCLLDPGRKKSYDKELREQLAKQGVAAGGPPTPPPKQAPKPPPLPSQRPPGRSAPPLSGVPPEPPPLSGPVLNIDVDTGSEASTIASYVAHQKKEKWIGRAVLVVIVLIVVIVLVVMALM